MSTTLDWISGGQRQSHTVTKLPEEDDETFFDRAHEEFLEQLAALPPD